MVRKFDDYADLFARSKWNLDTAANRRGETILMAIVEEPAQRNI